MNPNSKINLYRLIGCRPDSTYEQIRSAYRAKMRSVHSDKGGNTSDAQAVNLAWEVLRDQAKHEQYKSARASWAQQIGAVLCESCGEANRVRTTRGAVCGCCREPLGTMVADQYAEVKAAAIQLINSIGTALVSEVTRRIK